MSTQKECPICMEIIDFNKNCVTTECGHCFHANCLMTSVAHNGFGCPYCRTAMAEKIKDEQEEEDDDDETDSDYEEDMFNDDSLRGFRFFMNNIHGDTHEEEDLEEEDENEYYSGIRDRIRDPPPRPSAEFIVDKLLDDITVEDLVKVLLLEHEEYDDSQEELSLIERSVFEKMRAIISNFNPGEGLPRVNNLMSMINDRTECITYDWNTLFVHEEQLEYMI
jgi:hypothetical protein